VGAIVTFGTYTAIDFTIDAPNPPLTFGPVADTYANEALPTANNGANTTFRVLHATGTSQSSYLRFNVTGLNHAVQSAKLRLYVTNSSDLGGAIYSVSNNYQATTTPWTESGLIWNNAPAIGGAPLSSLGAVLANTWVEFDVTGAFNGNGVYNFGIQTSSSNDVRYSSKEDAASNQPQLVIQQSDAPLPSITGFSPVSALPGAEVTLNGTGFTGATSVTFGNIPAASFTIDSDTQIRVIVPAGAVSGKLSLTAAGGSSISEDTFSILTSPAPPVIDAFSPASGPAGTAVTIKGAGLGGATAVRFNAEPASSFTIDSDAQIRAIVPAGAVSGKVTVLTSNGTATSAASFVITPSTAPLHWVYLPLMLGGGGASVSSTPTETTAIYSAFGSWRASGNLRTFICALDLQ
jgi:hypothetical protein